MVDFFVDLFSDAQSAFWTIIFMIGYFFFFIKWPIEIWQKEIKKKDKNDKGLFLNAFKIIIFTILFFLIYYVNVKILWWKNTTKDCGFLCRNVIVNDWKGLVIFLIMISCFLIYYFIFRKEFKEILSKNKILAYIFLSVFQIGTVVLLLPNILYVYGLFSFITFKSFIVNILRYIMISLPCLILVIDVYGYLLLKIVKLKKRK